ncbi:tRNA-dihydrouridine(16) synthase [Saliniradius amylolyticus]|uniref:tRNA-dihydrouridine(16) synthase n=1 Tax=Saliniradius amylolyticus TaxID=2183582 RepID=A0A2S2E225_9ALTE|nr:tRNA-dihydrouridine synthase [Saliniradius amylolyticus]AWL11693.1 tRNA-dihydrouridine(16) synthase [Saliniradius amylolyticus]
MTKPKSITLAPMEGVVDALMRDMLTKIGGYDLCVTEFVRVVDQRLPRRVFYRQCSELKQGGLTDAGTPVRVQLLGQYPEWLAENAVRAIELGSHGVDLNFGCPAKTVNKSKGGAVLLKETETLYQIMQAVRQAVPSNQVVSAKMRLGFEDKSLALDNARALAEGGAGLITVHARTKTEGYKPPAYWDWIDKIRQVVDVPVIANGEIWQRQDALNCIAQSGCGDIMLGRGALAMPNLGQVVRGHQTPMSWPEVKELLASYSGYEIYGDKGKYYPNRVKQWLGYLKLQYPEAEALFKTIRVLKTAEDILPHLAA